MSQGRWARVLGVAASLGLLVGCTAPAKEAVSNAQPRFEDRKDSSERPNILVLTPYVASAHALWSSLRDEIGADMDVATLEMSPSVSLQSLEQALSRRKPKGVVLVGNQAVRLYRGLQQKGEKTPGAVVAMSSFSKQLASDLTNMKGITYEIPAVSGFVALRQLSSRSLKKIGVVYRQEFESFVENERTLARLEKFDLIGVPIEGKVAPRRIRLALRNLLRSHNVDAVWVLNDNALLEPAHIRDGWLPEVRASRVPVLVGVDSLVNPALSFGSVGVVPDHSALGVQVANLIYELSDENWRFPEQNFEPPFSVRTVVDMSQSSLIEFVPGADKHIDEKVMSSPSPLYF